MTKIIQLFCVCVFLWTCHAAVLSKTSGWSSLKYFLSLKICQTCCRGPGKTCVSTGSSKWHKRWKCVAVNCGKLKNPVNGKVIYARTTFESSAKYKCNAGYRLTYPASRTCMSNCKWSGSAPKCLPPVNCGKLNNPANGRVRTYGGTTFEKIAKYTCNPGYLLSYPASRTCLSTGKWSGFAPKCNPLPNCGNPPCPANGMVSTNGGTTFGHMATYSCKQGYQLSGPSSRFCLWSGSWSGSTPTCDPIPNCGNPPCPANGMVTTDGGTTVGHVATYSCDDDYVLGYPGARICKPDGSWSGSTPTCDPVADCGHPPCPANAIVRTDGGTTFGHIATYQCKSGYQLSHPVPRVCRWDGSWSGSTPTCDPTPDCGEPIEPENGAVSTNGGTTVGHIAQYGCDDGYELSGPSTRICKPDGTWSDSEPTCDPICCSFLEDPCNGEVEALSTTLNSVATYTCNEGYRLVGNPNRTCQADGQWDGCRPYCEEIMCDIPPAPDNGDIDISGSGDGAVVTYTCDTCFKLCDGDRTRTCLPSGQWSGTPPTCSPLPGFIPFQDSCYLFVSNGLSWNAAQVKQPRELDTVACGSNGGHLVEIESAAEQNFLKSQVMAAHAEINLWWIGGEDIQSEGDHVWHSTQTLIDLGTYTNWRPGQPNNLNEQDCVALRGDVDYKWVDRGCEECFAYICEIVDEEAVEEVMLEPPGAV